MTHKFPEQLLIKTIPKDITQYQESWAKREGAKPQAGRSIFYTAPTTVPGPKTSKATLKTGKGLLQNLDQGKRSNDLTSKKSKPATEVIFNYYYFLHITIIKKSM